MVQLHTPTFVLEWHLPPPAMENMNIIFDSMCPGAVVKYIAQQAILHKPFHLSSKFRN